MTHTILVTGANGTVGSALVRRLADHDVHTRAAVHSAESADNVADVADELFEIDMGNRDTLGPAFEDVDSAYLLTPFVPNQPALVDSLVNAATAAGVDHLVRQSALGATVEDPPHWLAAEHGEAEEIVREARADASFVRPTAFMQNLLQDAESVREQGVIYNPVGEPIALVDAQDVAAVAAAVLTDNDLRGGAFPVTGPEAITYGDIADVLTEALGREVEHVQVGMDDAREGMLDAGMPGTLVDGYIGLLESFDAGHGTTVYETVEEVTGAPARPIETFVEDHLDAFRS